MEINKNITISSSEMVKNLFSYSSVREISVENKCAAIFYRLFQLSILGYIIGYDIVWNRGYQITEDVNSAVSTKIKGFGFSSLLNTTGINFESKYDLFGVIKQELWKSNLKIFDAADYVVPPNEINSMFIMTSFTRTTQTKGICEESAKTLRARCKKDADCLSTDIPLHQWNGLPTGKCINSSIYRSIRVCEVNAWCPIEKNIKKDEFMIKNVPQYTILIDNDVQFKLFHRRERNILPNITNAYLTQCTYHETHDPHCPIFLLDYILKKAEPDEKERHEMLKRGGVLEISIAWNCNYDLFASQCYPKYTFSRTDIEFKHLSSSSAAGFNFRFSNKYQIDTRVYRDNFKAYGLRIFVSVTGEGRRFHVIPFIKQFGTGIGLMSISVILADFIMLNFSKNRSLFHSYKKLYLKEENLKDLNK